MIMTVERAETFICESDVAEIGFPLKIIAPPK